MQVKFSGPVVDAMNKQRTDSDDIGGALHARKSIQQKRCRTASALNADIDCQLREHNHGNGVIGRVCNCG